MGCTHQRNQLVKAFDTCSSSNLTVASSSCFVRAIVSHSRGLSKEMGCSGTDSAIESMASAMHIFLMEAQAIGVVSQVVVNVQAAEAGSCRKFASHEVELVANKKEGAVANFEVG